MKLPDKQTITILTWGNSGGVSYEAKSRFTGYLLTQEQLDNLISAKTPDVPTDIVDRYEGYCTTCNAVIKTNIQGNEIGTHYCNKSDAFVLSSLLDDINQLTVQNKIPKWFLEKYKMAKKHLQK